jgi:hypothetical protein
VRKGPGAAEAGVCPYPHVPRGAGNVSADRFGGSGSSTASTVGQHARHESDDLVFAFYHTSCRWGQDFFYMKNSSVDVFVVNKGDYFSRMMVFFCVHFKRHKASGAVE